MSYYFGFRHGWIRVAGHMIGWYDASLYHHWPGGVRIGQWHVWHND